MTYTISQTVQDGIERIVYSPEAKHFETPILMQHGTWHGAWCWQSWQELFGVGLGEHRFQPAGTRPIAGPSPDPLVYLAIT